ncbi:MAG: PVC-type heme-binding CxxCH protein, partial [Planctomycetota bacterium]|nr:PVC-type heme-binding CxxCH protein [Planctomycetota bacterium]
MRILLLVLIVLATWTSGRLSTADDRPEWQTSAPQSPEIAAASDEGANALAGFKLPKDIRGTLFAAEPMLANVVAFHVDAQGQLYACETFRQSKGVEDNRGHGHWLDDDLAAQTVEDRYAYIMKHLGEKAADYTRQDDRIRLLVDEDGDFVADKATVFADRFNEVVAGTGAGVLAYRDKVYYTCIPDLWMLEDTNGDYRSDQRKSLQYGYGVRFAFRGHDLHGLTLGPDGRLYFSIGDRGYNVQAADGQGINPASGAVFRCELDGSHLEVFAMGLRNPQELAFDDFGNLFTGDNNSDSGDKARWVYVVQGGDTGWRMHYQYLGDRGPFNREKIWHPFHEQTPAYIIPPVANFADGPSGLAYYPGTGFSDDFKGRFFLCDFRGQASNSGIRSLKVEAKGAFFLIAHTQRAFWKIRATDLQFAPDGGLSVSDWGTGWEGLGTGRIYRFSDARFQDSELVRET